MPNMSDLTRREQVLARLQEADGAWVDGTELATEVVGGSEGLKRLRELRLEGHSIKMRKKPDSDQYQYRLELQNVGPAQVDASIEVHSGPTYKTHVEPPERYDYKREAAKPRSKAHLGRTLDGTFVVVRDDEQGEIEDFEMEETSVVSGGQTSLGVPTVEPAKFDVMPKHIDLGLHRQCPLCKGYRKRVLMPLSTVAHGAKRQVAYYEDFCRDPRKSMNKYPCARCNGFGMAPARLATFRGGPLDHTSRRLEDDWATEFVVYEQPPLEELLQASIEVMGQPGATLLPELVVHRYKIDQSGYFRWEDPDA